MHLFRVEQNIEGKILRSFQTFVDMMKYRETFRETTNVAVLFFPHSLIKYNEHLNLFYGMSLNTKIYIFNEKD